MSGQKQLENRNMLHSHPNLPGKDQRTVKDQINIYYKYVGQVQWQMPASAFALQKHVLKTYSGRARWLTPVIPAFREAEVSGSPEVSSFTMANMTGRFPAEEPHGRQHDSFGRHGCFAGAPARRFPVRSIGDGRARLVPNPQGKQQLEALRTEFHSKHSKPGKIRLCGEGESAKGKLRNRKTSSPGGERSKMAT
ncbi:hypothetical protein AAY473_013728 [Plecturocebus cupreus]